jgi:hypothetical protein
VVKGGNAVKRFITCLVVLACFVVSVPQAFAKQPGSNLKAHLSQLNSTFPDGH